MDRIVVGLDGSASATAALNWAVGVAEVMGAELLLATAGQGSRAELEGSLTQWAEPASKASCPSRAVALVGDPRIMLGQFAAQEEADLIVVGAGEASWFPALHLGSVSHHLAQHSDRPVCVVPASSGQLGGRGIVVGLDGSPGSGAAADWAADLARRAGSTVLTVHAYEPAVSRLSSMPPEVARTEAEKACHEWSRKFVDANVPTEEFVEEEADPARSLANAIDRSHAGLIVVGTRGAGGFHGLRLGSVALRLLQHAAVPITLVPAPS